MQETLENPNKPLENPSKLGKCKNPKCKGRAIDATGFCYICHPETKKKAVEIGKKGGRPRKIKQLITKSTLKRTPKTIDDILEKIGDLWLYVETEEITTKQGAVILKGCEVALLALEQKELEEKLNMKVAR